MRYPAKEGPPASKEGAKPGMTFQAMREKARAGKLAGKQYPQDQFLAGKKGGEAVDPNKRNMTKTVEKSRLKNPRSTNDPTDPQYPRKPYATQ